MRRWPLLLALLGCEGPPAAPTTAELVQAGRDRIAIEAATPCTEVWFNLANSSFGGRCPRSDQKVSWEKDTDGDANLVCRCTKPMPAPAEQERP